MKVIPQRPDPIFSNHLTKFGQARAQRYQKRLQTLLKQNQTLIGAKNVTKDPLQTNLAHKQELVAFEIDRLHNKQKDEVLP